MNHSLDIYIYIIYFVYQNSQLLPPILICVACHVAQTVNASRMVDTVILASVPKDIDLEKMESLVKVV